MENSDLKYGSLADLDALDDDVRLHVDSLRAHIEARLDLMLRFRRALELTQVDVSRLLGLTQAAVSKMERRGDANLAILARMAEEKGKRLRLVVEAQDGSPEHSFLL